MLVNGAKELVIFKRVGSSEKSLNSQGGNESIIVVYVPICWAMKSITHTIKIERNALPFIKP
jgi:hypothetical protein